MNTFIMNPCPYVARLGARLFHCRKMAGHSGCHAPYESYDARCIPSNLVWHEWHAGDPWPAEPAASSTLEVPVRCKER